MGLLKISLFQRHYIPMLYCFQDLGCLNVQITFSPQQSELQIDVLDAMGLTRGCFTGSPGV